MHWSRRHARRPARSGGLIHHSDGGSQYLSIRYTERLAETGIEPSVGSVGDSYGNALARTIDGLYIGGRDAAFAVWIQPGGFSR